jgi:hypothetical protein
MSGLLHYIRVLFESTLTGIKFGLIFMLSLILIAAILIAFSYVVGDGPVLKVGSDVISGEVLE